MMGDGSSPTRGIFMKIAKVLEIDLSCHRRPRNFRISKHNQIIHVTVLCT
jgi:hypothetical protein